MKYICAILMIALFGLASDLRAQSIYGDVTLHGSLSVTNGFPAPAALSAVARYGGSYSNEGVTVYYRICATNRRGRTAWVQSGGVTSDWRVVTNSATLSWARIGAASGYVIERRTNAADWAQWIALGAAVTGYVDSASTAWTSGTFSGTVPAYTPTYPWTSIIASLDAAAWQNPAAATNWTWTSDGTQITLTGYTGPNAVVVPDMLDGLPVTTLGAALFNLGDITSISGGRFVTTIGAGAFNECSSLVLVTLPTIKTIAEYGFFQTGMTSLSLPAVESVGTRAFESCINLTALYFSANAPAEVVNVYDAGSIATNYVLNTTATGWGTNWNGRPVVRSALAGDGTAVTGVAKPGDLADYVPLSGATMQSDANLLWPDPDDTMILPYAVFCRMFLVGDDQADPGWGAAYDAGNDRYLIGPWNGQGIGGDDSGLPGYYFLQRYTRTEADPGPREIATTAAPGWQAVTNLASSIVVTNLFERPYYLYSTGAVAIAFSGLRSPAPIYLVVRGPTSVTFPGAHFVGGASWQTDASNHFIAWQYGTNIFINPVTTSED